MVHKHEGVIAWRL